MQETFYISIPEWSLSLLKRDGYMQRFYFYKSKGKTNLDAWEIVESELYKYFKTNRYTSLGSFQSSMQVWQKNKKLELKK